MDDVPLQFKKRSIEEQPGHMSEEQRTKRFRLAFFSYTMAATVEGGKKRIANQ